MKTGRPRTIDKEQKVVGVRLSLTLIEELKKEARERGITLSAYIRILLEGVE